MSQGNGKFSERHLRFKVYGIFGASQLFCRRQRSDAACCCGHTTVQELGPDLQNVSRHSYDNLTTVPTLRLTFDGRLIYSNILRRTQGFPYVGFTCSILRSSEIFFTRLTALCPGLPGWPGTRKVKTNQDFTEAKRQWVAVASTGLYATLHLTPDK